jgi:hypothetical protein
MHLFITSKIKEMKKRDLLQKAFLLIAVMGLMSFSCKKDIPTTVAFTGTYTTTNELIDPPPMLKQKITGVGKSNELNITKFIAISTQNMGTPPPFKLSGKCTWYAENGDEFYSDFAGTATPGTDGTITVAMTHTITGGTGKFSHASGTIEGKTIFDPKKPTGSIESKGTISF